MAVQRQRHRGGSMDVSKTNRLGKHLREFLKERAYSVGLEVDAVSILPRCFNSGLDELCKLPLKTRRWDVKTARKFAKVPGSLRLEQDCRQQMLLGFRQQNIQDLRTTLHA